MQTPEVIYQYLLQYTDGTDDSDEAVERANQALYALMDLLDEAGRGGIFSAKDIPALWNVVVRMELELEDEDSYNIEWSVKDQLLELIMNLVCMDGVSKWADTLAEMVDQGRQIDRAYMKTAVEHLLSFFLFGKTGEEGQNEAENRIAFGEALQRKIPDSRQMLLTYCEAYLDAWMDDYSVTRRGGRPAGGLGCGAILPAVLLSGGRYRLEGQASAAPAGGRSAPEPAAVSLLYSAFGAER